MRTAVIFLLCLLFLAGSAQAYILNIYAPPEIRAGAPLEVTGNTTFPAGTQFDLVIYRLQPSTPEEVARKIIIVDESKSFQASFPTSGLESGDYKVEARFPTDPGSKIGSDSVTLRVFRITDRSGEIILTVSTDQVLGEALRIEGYIPKAGVTTITMKVSGPQGAVLPPQDVRTTTRIGRDEGYFSKTIPVGERGNYYVDFYDLKGFMATVKFMVDTPATGTSTVTPEVTAATPDTLPPTRVSVPLAGCCAGLLGAGLLAWRTRRR
ncbi:MAG: hypothetical protein MUC66_05665 [Methanolinea sp.]|jgi:hypothetical protein|nr:hypothetical protein [Methanolinea sp.]